MDLFITYVTEVEYDEVVATDTIVIKDVARFTLHNEVNSELPYRFISIDTNKPIDYNSIAMDYVAIDCATSSTHVEFLDFDDIRIEF